MCKEYLIISIFIDIIFYEVVLMSRYIKDNVVTGYVTGIEPYGIFISLDDYYTGLIHISEISSNFVRDVADYVTIGEKIKVKVIDVNDKNHQVKLSIKDIKYKSGDKAKINETVHGFSTLQSKLPYWIQEKNREIDKNDNL